MAMSASVASSQEDKKTDDEKPVDPAAKLTTSCILSLLSSRLVRLRRNGVSVTGTMHHGLFCHVGFWQWKVASAALIIAPFLAVDLIFLGANLLRIFEGGWLPLVLGASLMLMMLT